MKPEAISFPRTAVAMTVAECQEMICDKDPNIPHLICNNGQLISQYEKVIKSLYELT